MTAKSEQKERTHETILASASRLLREKGIGGARVADVMKGAGLTVGGFYAHFASKEALVDDTLRRTAREMRERLFARIEEKPEGERLEVILKRYLSTVHRDETTDGCPLPSVVGEVATTAPEHREPVAEHVEDFAKVVEAQLPRGEGVSRRHTALALVALMYGGLSIARALRGTELSDEMLRACRAFGRAAARSSGGS